MCTRTAEHYAPKKRKFVKESFTSKKSILIHSKNNEKSFINNQDKKKDFHL